MLSYRTFDDAETVLDGDPLLVLLGVDDGHSPALHIDGLLGEDVLLLRLAQRLLAEVEDAGPRLDVILLGLVAGAGEDLVEEALRPGEKNERTY